MTAGTLVSKPTTSSMPRGGRAQALRVGQSEADGGHACNDCLGVADEPIPIMPQGLSLVDLARPGLAVGVGDEGRDPQPIAASPNHRQAQPVPTIASR